jgi:hypothetical protein
MNTIQYFDFKPDPDGIEWIRLEILCTAAEAFALQQSYCDALLARARTTDKKERARQRLKMTAAVRHARRIQAPPRAVAAPPPQARLSN